MAQTLSRALNVGDWISVIKTNVTSPVNIKSTPGIIGAIHVDNSGSTANAFVQLIDASGAGTLGTNVIDVITILAGDAGGIVYPMPGVYASNSGLSVGVSTTFNGSTVIGTG